MRKRVPMGILVTAAALAAIAPVGASGAASFASTLTLAPGLTTGKVGSANAACRADRSVVVRYTDAKGRSHVFGKGKSDASGRYTVTPGATPGKLPFTFRAITASRKVDGVGVCKGAASKKRVVAGG